MSVPSLRRGFPRDPVFSPYISAYCYVVKRSLSAAEFKALNSTAITLVAASPQYYYVPVYTSWKKSVGITYSVGAVTGLQCRVGTTALTNTGAPTGAGLSPLWHILMYGPGSAAALSSGTDLAGTPLSSATINLFAAGGNPATGGAGVDGVIDVEVGFRRIPVLS